jgi:hypothetical protein
MAAVRPAGTDLRQGVLQRLDGLRHLLASADFLDVGDAHEGPYWTRGCDQTWTERALVLAGDDPREGPFLEDREDLDRQPLVAAQGEGGGIHHLSCG